MNYDYIRQAYGVSYEVGERVQHTVTKRIGTVVREGRTNVHYVRVRFGSSTSKSRNSYCHPLELTKLGIKP